MLDTHSVSEPSKPRLLDQVRDKICFKHCSIRAETAYVDWIRRFILFHDKRHPKDMGGPEVEAFLTHLATVGKVSASTQNQALAALLFLYREVLAIELPWLDNIHRAKRSQKMPVVLTANEVRALFARMEGLDCLMASLLYGSGMRLMECVRLRVKDLDFEMKQITVRNGKGGKDRVIMLPERLISPLKAHLNRVRIIHEQDLTDGFGVVYLPFALGRKYVFPSRSSRRGSFPLILDRKRNASTIAHYVTLPYPGLCRIGHSPHFFSYALATAVMEFARFQHCRGIQTWKPP